MTHKTLTPLFLFHWGAAIPREPGHLASMPGDTSYKVTALTASTVTERRAWNQLAVPALCSPVGEALHLSSDTCNSSRMTYSHLHLQRKNLRQRRAPGLGASSRVGLEPAWPMAPRLLLLLLQTRRGRRGWGDSKLVDLPHPFVSSVSHGAFNSRQA